MKKQIKKFNIVTDSLIDFYIKNGFVLIKNPFKKILILKIKKYVDSFLKKKNFSDYHKICNQIMDKFETTELYEELIHDEKIKNLMKKFLGNDLCVLNFTALWINSPTNKNPVLKKNDHVDAWTGTGVDTIFLKVFLTDCDKYNGMSVYPGTHLHGLYPVRNRTLDLPKDVKLPSKINIINAKKGDLLLWHPLLVHATTGQSDKNTRISMTLRYKSTESEFTSQERALGYRTISVGVGNIIKRYIGNDLMSPFRVYGGSASIDKRLSKMYDNKYYYKNIK